MDKGNSISNAIIIETQDYLSGVVEEHNHIDQICENLNISIKAIEQNLIMKNDRKYDVFNLEMEDGSKIKVCFDITSFFIS
jgi:hypothetical protein